MKSTIRLTESELHNLISETVKKVLKEYDDFDLDYLGDTVNGAPLSRSRFRNNRYGSEPVTDYLKQTYGNYEKDNSPMGFFKISFNDPHKKTPISIKSISYKKLQCLKNDLEEKFGNDVGEVIISKTKSFSEEERKIYNKKIEQVYKHLLNANW